MNININAIGLLEGTLGVQPVRLYFPEAGAGPKGAGLSVNPPGTLEVTASSVRSVFGRPVVDEVVFGPVTDPVTGERFEGWTLPPATLLTVTRQKSILETEVQGRDGAVRELISHGDYQVRIRGLIVSGSSAVPEDDITSLVAMAEVRAALPVSSRLLGLLRIDSLVVRSFQLADQEGYSNLKVYELDCVSDTPVELQIKNGL